MDNVIIKSELLNVKKFRNLMLAVGIMVLVLGLMGNIYYGVRNNISDYERAYSSDWYDEDEFAEYYGENGAMSYAVSTYFSYELTSADNTIVILLALPILIIGLVVYAATEKTSITVTDKRVYGTATFGKRVDLPLDSISAIALGGFKGIAITTASGAIKFSFVKNREEIYNVVSKLLVERQTKSSDVVQTIVKQEVPQSNADELKKFKELLDCGIITQEEFDAKKKQLLGL